MELPSSSFDINEGWMQAEYDPDTNNLKSLPFWQYQYTPVQIDLTEDEYQQYKNLLSWKQVLTATGVTFKVRSTGRIISLCAFHKEKTPSTFYYPDTNRYHCFGCGLDGDIVEFVSNRFFNQEIVDGLDIENFYRSLSDTHNPHQLALPLRDI